MAIETDKNNAPDSEGEVAESATKIAGDSRPVRFRGWRVKRPGKKTMLGAFLAILLLIAAAVFLNHALHIGQKVYAQAAGHKIYKSDIDELVGSEKGISQHKAATVLANKYLTEAMAKEQGITVTSKDLEATYGSSFAKQKTSNGYAYQNLVNQVYFTKLRNNNNGVYKGQLLVTNFSRYVAYQSPLLAEQKATSPDIGNPAAIAADKKYAQDLIDSLYNQIKSGKITFDQAIQMERNDPVEGVQAYPILSHSGPFDSSTGPVALFQPASALERIRQLKPGQISKPFVVRVSNSVYDGSTAESYFLVVKMDSVSGHPTGMSFDQYLTQAEKKLRYRVYV